jgi:hypothetical protein
LQHNPQAANQTNNGSSVHLLLRIPFLARIEGLTFDIVEAHNDVIRSMGKTSFAKFGHNIRPTVEKIRGHISKGHNPLLVLTIKRGTNYLGYSSPITSIYDGKPRAELIAYAPSYYCKIDPTFASISHWITVERPFEKFDLAGLRLASNKRPLLEVLKECRTSTMLVETKMSTNT